MTRLKNFLKFKGQHQDSSTRSILKAVSWRFVGSLATTAVVFVLTQKISVAITVGGFEAVMKIGLFFAHERVWDRISFGKKEKQASVIWLTGLPGSGKSTLAEKIVNRFSERGFKVEHLDGDLIRNLFPQTGFEPRDRDEHIRRVGLLASRLERHGIHVVASFVSPYRESRKFVRKLCRNFIEIHVATPLSECEKRDPKGLYLRAKKGEILSFTGISAPYEEPEAPELRLDTTSEPILTSASKIFNHLDML